MKTEIISYLYKAILRKLLFKIDPEVVHDNFLNIGEALGQFDLLKQITHWSFYYENKNLNQTILGIKFKNPIGLSAGFDKDARLTQILPDVGFGFEEIGTVTLKSYGGNPKPRLIRLPNSKGLIVNYGLKNLGAEKIIRKLKSKLHPFPVAVSIGKTNSKDTVALHDGINDYVNCFKQFSDNDIGDFYVINISCPNTFGGEPFTTPRKLDKLLGKIKAVKTNKPLLIKTPINLRWREFKKLLDVAVAYRIDGVIIGNLNKDRSDRAIKDKIPKSQKGGISGLPTKELSNMLISKTYKTYGNKLVIVGVGGVFSGADAYEKIKLGASLVSLITGMIYEGPQLIGQINRDLVKLMEQDGYKNISEAIGASLRTI